MSIKPLPDTAQPFSEYCPETTLLKQRFFKTDGHWYVSSSNDESIGPFSDKADAQMALLYYSVRSFWPNPKQLREFARNGL